MKIPVLVILILIIAGWVYYFINTPLEKLVPEQVIPKTTGMTENQAIENVKKLPEVQDYLQRVPNGRVEVDNELEGEYNVHVYELKDGHSATFNWYTVSIKSGQPEAQFESGNAQESSTTKGTVTGKLCYPSEYLPEGIVEAKRLSDQKVFILNYGGSEAGEGNSYEVPLEDGGYYFRYKTKTDLSGYL